MRMSQAGLSAADVVNTYDEEDIANIIYELGANAARAPLPAPSCAAGESTRSRARATSPASSKA